MPACISSIPNKGGWRGGSYSQRNRFYLTSNEWIDDALMLTDPVPLWKSLQYCQRNIKDKTGALL
jgi:hypothetical protein